MMIQCPNCQTQYRLEELRDQLSLQIRCRQCQKTFPVLPPQEPVAQAGRSVPIQPHDEFNKRLRSVAPPVDSLKATTIRGNATPWLDRNKVFSLVVIDGPLKGKVIKPKVLLGRSETDIVLEDSEISRKHCALEVHGSFAMLVDLGSTNGTFVDEQRIESCQLEHMSEFRMGSTVVMFSARAKE
jgi:predicted Zn finger-like uncharacterized protein